MTKVGIRTCAHDPLAAAPRCGVCFTELEEQLLDRTHSLTAAAEVMTALSVEKAALEAELAAAETLCKIYFDLAIFGGWDEDALRAERDRLIAAGEDQMPDSSESHIIPQMTMTPTADGRVLLETGLGGSRQTATIPRVAARAAIRCLNFVIPEWLWSEKDPE